MSLVLLECKLLKFILKAVLRQLPRRNLKTNPKSNPSPNTKRGAIFLGGNCPNTIQGSFLLKWI